jgi:lipopolysaccharide biosynthesis glycosyltransferase
MLYSDSSQSIAVAFAINDGYVDWLGVTILSILKNNRHSMFQFFVLSSDITEVSKQKLLFLGTIYKNFQIRYIVLDDTIFGDFPLRIKHISKDAYFRYVLPDVLPDNDKVLYLDSDVLVLGAIEPLWNTNLGHNFIAGSHKPYIATQFPGYRESLGLRSDDLYINSGVILMNLAEIRKSQKVTELFENTIRLKNIIKIQDQDVINITFKARIKPISNIYNYTTRDRIEKTQSNEGVIIVHFNTANKPWKNDYVCTEDDEYFAEIYNMHLVEYKKLQRNNHWPKVVKCVH